MQVFQPGRPTASCSRRHTASHVSGRSSSCVRCAMNACLFIYPSCAVPSIYNLSQDVPAAPVPFRPCYPTRQPPIPFFFAFSYRYIAPLALPSGGRGRMSRIAPSYPTSSPAHQETWVRQPGGQRPDRGEDNSHDAERCHRECRVRCRPAAVLVKVGRPHGCRVDANRHARADHWGVSCAPRLLACSCPGFRAPPEAEMKSPEAPAASSALVALLW